MCGICGVWEYGAGEGRVERALVERMRDVMTHRGPDDAGALVFDEGQRRREVVNNDGQLPRYDIV